MTNEELKEVIDTKRGFNMSWQDRINHQKKVKRGLSAKKGRMRKRFNITTQTVLLYWF
jgi:hypothetical protein